SDRTPAPEEPRAGRRDPADHRRKGSFFSSRRRHTRLVSDWEFRRVLFRSNPSTCMPRCCWRNSAENWTSRKGLPSGGPAREISKRSQRSIWRAAGCAARREAKGARALARIVRRVSVMIVGTLMVLEGQRYGSLTFRRSPAEFRWPAGGGA